jgi:hypothetical protein
MDAVAVSIQSVTVGEERFATAGTERAPWLDRFLRGLAGRFHRHDPSVDPAELALRAATSRGRHDDYIGWQGDLRARGFDARAARGPGARPLLLVDGLPVRRHGEPARTAAALAASIHLSGADIVWAETTDEGWLGAAAGEGSPVEQVWRVSPAGDLEPSSTSQPSNPLDMERG